MPHGVLPDFVQQSRCSGWPRLHRAGVSRLCGGAELERLLCRRDRRLRLGDVDPGRIHSAAADGSGVPAAPPIAKGPPPKCPEFVPAINKVPRCAAARRAAFPRRGFADFVWGSNALVACAGSHQDFRAAQAHPLANPEKQAEHRPSGA
jgi:hypothetical protein